MPKARVLSRNPYGQCPAVGVGVTVAVPGVVGELRGVLVVVLPGVLVGVVLVQPCNAALTILTISSILTTWSPFTSPGQGSETKLLSAASTALMISLIVTVPSPFRSPGQSSA